MSRRINTVIGLRMAGQPRQHRMSAAIPVELEGGASALTRDISASGIYFVTDADLSEGSAIRFSVEFDSPSGKMFLECNGEVVRIERGGGKLGVGARILESRLERRNVGITKQEAQV